MSKRRPIRVVAAEGEYDYDDYVEGFSSRHEDDPGDRPLSSYDWREQRNRSEASRRTAVDVHIQFFDSYSKKWFQRPLDMLGERGPYVVVIEQGGSDRGIANTETDEVVARGLYSISDAQDTAWRWNTNPMLAPDTGGGNDWEGFMGSRRIAYTADFYSEVARTYHALTGSYIESDFNNVSGIIDSMEQEGMDVSTIVQGMAHKKFPGRYSHMDFLMAHDQATRQASRRMAAPKEVSQISSWSSQVYGVDPRIAKVAAMRRRAFRDSENHMAGDRWLIVAPSHHSMLRGETSFHWAVYPDAASMKESDRGTASSFAEAKAAVDAAMNKAASSSQLQGDRWLVTTTANGQYQWHVYPTTQSDQPSVSGLASTYSSARQAIEDELRVQSSRRVRANETRGYGPGMPDTVGDGVATGLDDAGMGPSYDQSMSTASPKNRAMQQQTQPVGEGTM